MAHPLHWISPEIENRAGAFCSEFRSNIPFSHLVIDNFLEDDFCQELITQFPEFDATRAMNEHGEVGRKAVFEKVRKLGSAYRAFDEMIRSSPFLRVMSQMTGIANLIYDPEYIGGGTHENLPGQDLDPHIDFNYHPRRGWHRRLNLILFLNPEWREQWGGNLELHLNPWLSSEKNRVKTVVPLRNRCVLFETSEASWHGFRRIELPSSRSALSRRSLAIYYYTESRPEDQVAPDHSTVYVQRQLSEHIQPGRTLSEQDFKEIRELIVRRDHYIKFLYDRELYRSDDFNFLPPNPQRDRADQDSRLDALIGWLNKSRGEAKALRELLGRVEQSPSYRLGRTLSWPIRKILGR